MAMRLHVEARLDYDFPEDVEALLHLEVAHGPDQTIVAENLTFDPPIAHARLDDPATGERRVVFRHRGGLKVTYVAMVDLKPRETALAGARQHAVADLPVDVLPFLRGSRFVESDRFEQIARHEFGLLTGGDRVEAILNWLRTHLAYRPGSSDATTTAIGSYVNRQGVCRDYAHVAAALCRASDIPARLVSAYALGLDPPDFHAVIEAYVGGGWRLADPTGLVSPTGLVRIGEGRDAADIAFLTIFGEAMMIAQSVTVRDISEEAAKPAAA
jgi:transglutaminase-like putative cysteine protease